MDKIKNSDKAQGAEIADKKEQKASISVALKAVTKHVKTIHEANLIGLSEFEQITEILTRAKSSYIKIEFGL